VFLDLLKLGERQPSRFAEYLHRYLALADVVEHCALADKMPR